MPATGNVVLDTSVAIAHLRGVGSVTENFRKFENLYLPMVALGELLCGLHRSSRPAENSAGLRHWLETLTLISLTEKTAESYAEIKAGLFKAGTPIPENDIWIAAHAKELNVPLAARDEHFQRISGLTILDWR
jgi:tRNA(fMet)-specific endonuclease VapC